jgi:hypothetical protein
MQIPPLRWEMATKRTNNDRRNSNRKNLIGKNVLLGARLSWGVLVCMIRNSGEEEILDAAGVRWVIVRVSNG